MKKSFSIIKPAIFVLAFLAFISAPLLASADSLSLLPFKNADDPETDVCAVLPKALEKLDRSPFKQSFIASHFEAVSENKEVERLAVDKLKKELRQKEDMSITLHIERLREIAENNDERAAIDEYKKLVWRAVREKREAADAVIDRFRMEMDKLNEVRLSRAENDLSIFDRFLVFRLRRLIGECEDNKNVTSEEIAEELEDLKKSEVLEEVFDFSAVEWAIQERRDQALLSIDEKYKEDIKAARGLLMVDGGL